MLGQDTLAEVSWMEEGIIHICENLGRLKTCFDQFFVIRTHAFVNDIIHLWKGGLTLL